MLNQPTAAFLIIGNEILSGRTQDTNLHYLANSLTAKGIRLEEAHVVPDIEEKIIEAVNILRTRYRYVFTSGGIGPTHDDITTESIAHALDVKVMKHPEAWKMLEDHYRDSPYVFNEARQKMAMIPEGATLILNPLTAAPGFILKNIYVMAGVPAIFQAMVNQVTAALKGGAVTLSHTIRTDLPEGAIALELGRIQQKYPEVQIGSYPSFKHGERSVSLVLRYSDETRLNEVGKEITALIRESGGKVLG